jgi:hypothetical protein
VGEATVISIIGDLGKFPEGTLVFQKAQPRLGTVLKTASGIPSHCRPAKD